MHKWLFALLAALLGACAPRTTATQAVPLEKTSMADLDARFFTAGIFQQGALVATPRPYKQPTGEMFLLVLVRGKRDWVEALSAGKSTSGYTDFDKLIASNQLRVGTLYLLDDDTYGISLRFPSFPDDPHPTAKAFSSLDQVEVVHLRQSF